MDLRLLAVSCFKKYGLLTQMSVVFSISSSFIGLLLFACRLSLTEIYFDFPVTYSTLWVPICSFKSCRKPTFAERNRSALKAKDISIQKTCPCKASTERTYGSFYLKKNIYKHLIIFFFFDQLWENKTNTLFPRLPNKEILKYFPSNTLGTRVFTFRVHLQITFSSNPSLTFSFVIFCLGVLNESCGNYESSIYVSHLWTCVMAGKLLCYLHCKYHASLFAGTIIMKKLCYHPLWSWIEFHWL